MDVWSGGRGARTCSALICAENTLTRTSMRNENAFAWPKCGKPLLPLAILPPQLHKYVQLLRRAVVFRRKRNNQLIVVGLLIAQQKFLEYRIWPLKLSFGRRGFILEKTIKNKCDKGWRSAHILLQVMAEAKKSAVSSKVRATVNLYDACSHCRGFPEHQDVAKLGCSGSLRMSLPNY